MLKWSEVPIDEVIFGEDHTCGLDERKRSRVWGRSSSRSGMGVAPVTSWDRSFKMKNCSTERSARSMEKEAGSHELL